MTIAHDRGAPFDGQFHLLLCHGRFVKVIARSPTDFHVDQSFGGRQIGIDARIDHLQPETVLTGQEADTGPASQKIGNHLTCHLLGRQTHPLIGYAMVAGENDVIGTTQPRRERLLDTPDLHGQFFEPAERSFRLGQRIDFLPQGGNDFFGRSADRKFFHHS